MLRHCLRDKGQGSDTSLIGRAQKRFPEFFRGDLAAQCVDAGFHGSDVFLAVIAGPVIDQETRRVAQRPYDLARSRAAQSEPNRREC